MLQAYSSILKDDARYNGITEKVTEWFSQNPESPDGIINIVQSILVVQDQNAQKEGEKMLRMVLDNFPDHRDARLSLAVLLQMTERYDEAEKQYQKVIELQPDNVIAMNNLAWIRCEEQGRFEEALALVETGLKLQPAYADLIDTRGVTYYRMGKFEKAIKDFNLCIKLLFY